jgi:hypothetical protein
VNLLTSTPLVLLCLARILVLLLTARLLVEERPTYMRGPCATR